MKSGYNVPRAFYVHLDYAVQIFCFQSYSAKMIMKIFKACWKVHGLTFNVSEPRPGPDSSIIMHNGRGEFLPTFIQLSL